MNGNETRSSCHGSDNRFKAGGRAWLTLLFALVVPSMPGLCVRVSAQVPGQELFAKEPRTPLELWDAIDYLLRTNQAKKALPFFDKFVKSQPNELTFITIRNRYGLGSILRLSDDVLTRPFAKFLLKAMVAAARKCATQPDRIARFTIGLTKTPPEQDYAVRRLREAGPYPVPFLVERLSQKDLLAGDLRLIVDNMGRLGRSVVPTLAAVLDSPDLTSAADVATALGMIGDKRAIPYLTYLTALSGTPSVVRIDTQAALGHLTGRSFEDQLRTPVQVLTDAIWQFHRHHIELIHEPVVIWEWSNEQKTVVLRNLPATEAEAILGLRFVEALRLFPDRLAQVLQLSLAFEKAIERVGFT